VHTLTLLEVFTSVAWLHFWAYSSLHWTNTCRGRH